MATQHPSHRALLREDEVVLVLAVLVAQRRKRNLTEARCIIDLHDVLESLHSVGYCIVPCGVIDAIKRQLTSYGTGGILEDVLRLAAAKFGPKPHSEK